VLIEGYLMHVTPVFGEGPVDSLMNAMALVKKFHDENREIVPGASPKTARRKAQQKTQRKPAKSRVQRKRSRSSSSDTRRP
jgi:hypothetical protein